MSDPTEPTAGRASEDELSALCQSCGLCCDGSLFGRVGLEAEEVEGARKRRLHVVGGGRAFEQPCSAFVVAADAVGARESRDRGGCAIYGERPLACRRFACRLYDTFRREGGSLEESLSVVRRVRELLASVVTPSRRPGAAEAAQARAELARILDESFARV
jgi:Fe-S-cluster containining protein